MIVVTAVLGVVGAEAAEEEEEQTMGKKELAEMEG